MTVNWTVQSQTVQLSSHLQINNKTASQLQTCGPPITNFPDGWRWYTVCSSRYCPGTTARMTCSMRSRRRSSTDTSSECWTDMTIVWTRKGTQAPFCIRYSHVTYNISQYYCVPMHSFGQHICNFCCSITSIICQHYLKISTLLVNNLAFADVSFLGPPVAIMQHDTALMFCCSLFLFFSFLIHREISSVSRRETSPHDRKWV